MAPIFTLKPDVFYDISGNDPGTPLDQVTSAPYALCARAAVARYWPTMKWATFSVEEDPIAIDVWQATRTMQTRYFSYGYILQGKIDQQIEAFLSSNQKAGAIVSGRWQGEMPPCADVELELDIHGPKKPPKKWIEPLRGADWAAQIKQWLDGVEQGTGVKPAIYTAAPQWKYMLDHDGNTPSWTSQYQFWVKYYPSPFKFIDMNASFTPFMLPHGVLMSQVIAWQYFDQGRTYDFEFNDINTMTPAGKALYDTALAGGMQRAEFTNAMSAEPPAATAPQVAASAKSIARVIIEFNDGTREVRAA